MQINILPIVTFLAVIQYINSKILKEVIQNEQYQITLSLENDEEIIDFKNNQNQSNDRIKCEIQPCQCYFIYQNEKSGQISNIQCKQNTITFFRTNTNLSIIQKENKYRITTETYTDNDMPNFKTISSGLTLKWKFNIDGTIEFATIWNKLTWLGIGFGSSMRNVDMITINVLGSTVGLIDLYSISDFTPPTDSSQDYTLISYQVGTSSVKTRFSRKLSTGDSKDKTLTKGSTYTWCYAYSNAQSMELHTYYAGFSITLSDSSSASTNSTSTVITNSTSNNTSSTTSIGSNNTSYGLILSNFFFNFILASTIVLI